jgi:hypothetical protein
VPALYFGNTKMNNSFDLVDEVAREAGGAASLFVKSGDQFVRVATNATTGNGSRALGVLLDPKGPAIERIRRGELPSELSQKARAFQRAAETIGW